MRPRRVKQPHIVISPVAIVLWRLNLKIHFEPAHPLIFAHPRPLSLNTAVVLIFRQRSP